MNKKKRSNSEFGVVQLAGTGSKSPNIYSMSKEQIVDMWRKEIEVAVNYCNTARDKNSKDVADYNRLRKENTQLLIELRLLGEKYNASVKDYNKLLALLNNLSDALNSIQVSVKGIDSEVINNIKGEKGEVND